MGQVMGIIIGAFSQAQPDPLENLRLAVERAEAAGVEQDTLDDVRTKLAELENEVGKELSISVRHAVSGETLTVVRARPSDTPAYLREHVLRATGDGGVALHFLFQSQASQTGDVTPCFQIVDWSWRRPRMVLRKKCFNARSRA
ncbi:HET-E1 [Symbiodinium sp. CCMP2592]|nr:HET-E1 [Symbiodinium sp. CCMP2592]